jgi:signal transduction histidine kinase/DNA-binding response OmpR family regulator
MQGVDFIMEAVMTFDSKLDNQFKKHDYYKDFYLEMKSHIKNIRSTNAFMLMTVNRCIDFTKATRGLQITPNLDSIHFHETLSLPLNCMKNIQDRIQITLLPLSHKINCHIITDKQWLQENILCLLSNAVKYSTCGTVTMKVYLQENDEFVLSHADLRNEEKNLYVRKETVGRSASSSDKHASHYTNGTKTLTFADIKEARGKSSPPSESIRKKTSMYKFIVFEIEDTGIGMEEETMKTLFSPFKQAQRLAGGTGLGLYSLSKRVEALEGKYGVSRRRDDREGSLFWFSIPYRPDYTLNSARVSDESSISMTTRSHERNAIYEIRTRSRCSSTASEHEKIGPSPRAAQQRTQEKGVHHHRRFRKHSITASFLIKDDQEILPSIYETKAIVGRPLRVLLVEDSHTIAKMTCIMLNKLGHEVDLAENGHTGLKKMIKSLEGFEDNEDCSPTKTNNRRYDVVLMDFQMPVMDGLEATKRFREYEKRLLSALTPTKPGTLATIKTQKKLLIIGLSATTDRATVEEGINVGLDDILYKPLSAETFNNKIYQFL